MTYYRQLIQVEILSDSPWTGEQLEQLDLIHEAITDGDSSGMVTVQLLNQELSREDMEHALTVQGSDPSFLIHDDEDEDFEQARRSDEVQRPTGDYDDPDMGPSADLWVVHYEIRTGIDDSPVARGLVEVDGPYLADAHRHAKNWVAEHDPRFDERIDPYTFIIQARPARED